MKPITKLLPLLSLLIIGCATTYTKPQLATPNNWSVTTATTSDESNLPYLAWWQGFNDPLLNQLVESAIANNNSLNMSRSHIEAAEGELKKIQFQWIPDINVLLGYSNNPATGFPGLLAVLAPNYTLNIFGQIKQQQRAEYELAAAKAEDDAVKLTVISQVAASYFTYQAELEHRQLLQNLIDDTSNLLNINQKLYVAGITPETHVEELQAQLNLLQGEMQEIEQNIITSRNALRYLINQVPGDLSPVKNFSDLHNPRLIPGALPLTVLENRPDMEMATNQLFAASSGVGIAQSQLLPTVQLDFIGGPVAGNNSYHFPTPITTNVVDFNDELLKIPVFNMSALGAIAKSEGLNKVAYYNYMDVFQKALRNTTNALSAHAKITAKLTQVESSVEHLHKAYQLNQQLYQRGISSKLSTLDSKIVWDQIQIKQNQTRLQQLITVVNLYQELAGGYKSAESAPSGA